jgi:chromatin remodeling complex protein RSC6
MGLYQGKRSAGQKNRRMINADERLKTIFKKDQVSMFDLGKIVNNNVKK